MAESEQGGEKTEDASQRRIDQAREKGQVPRSRELTNFATMIGGSGTLIVIGGTLVGRLSHIMRASLSIDPQQLADPGSMTASLGEAAASAIVAVLPVFGTCAGLVLLASVAFGGWNFSPAAMIPDFSRMNPISGLARLFGLHGVTELGKALLKCMVVAGVCAGIVSWLFKDVMALGHMAPRTAIGKGVGLLAWSFVWLGSSLALIALVDVPLQLFQYNRSMKMTRQELRDEAKDSEGRPEVKSKIRQMQQALARRRMMHKVPEADVVVVNPTHFAVALKYDPQNMAAPRVLAKGVDLIALNIRRIAAEHRVPVFEAPKLARALYKSTDINREIPAGLYMAVAQVLSYVFRVKTLNPSVAARMARPDPTVGDEYADV